MLSTHDHVEHPGGDDAYRAIFDAHPQPMWVYDLRTLAFVAVNDAAIEKYGYSRDEFLGMTIADIRPPEDVLSLLQNVASVGPGFDHAGVWRHRLRDGRVIEVEITSHPIVFAGRRCELVMATDITARRQVEHALRESEAWFRTLFEQAVVGVAQVQLETGRIVRANQRYCDIVGYSCEEVVGMTTDQLTHPEDVDATRSAWERLRAGDLRETTLEKRYRRKDGTTVWASLAITSIWGGRDRPDFLVGYMQDITERKAAEQQLDQVRQQLFQAQKLEALGRLAGGIAHDLNNVLMPIVGYTQLIMADLPPGGRVHTDLLEVSRAAERASGLVRQILAFSRKQVLQLEDIDVNALIRDFVPMLRRLLGEGVTLDLRLDESAPNVRADRSQIEQVVLNLAINARDAMPRGGTLIIETAAVDVPLSGEAGSPGAPEGRCLRLTLRDDGQGMDAHTREHLFEPFFTTKREGEGTGLGLATVFGIVSQHGGSIAVDSEPGRGACFTILLRALQPRSAAGPSVVTSVPADVTPRVTVLVVEDDPSVRRFVLFALRTRNFVAYEASGAEEALSVAASVGGFDLLLTDVVMPAMNGFELFQRLKVRRPALKVLFMSGYPDDVLADTGLSGPLPLLQKPFSADALVAKVQSVYAA